MPPANLTYFLPQSGQKKGKFAGLINNETCCGVAGIPKRATASRPYELFDEPYEKKHRAGVKLEGATGLPALLTLQELHTGGRPSWLGWSLAVPDG